MIDPHAYNITIRKGNFEGDICFEARVKELPDLTEYAASYDEAYLLAIDSIEATAEVLLEKGKHLPVPQILAADYSGRVTLRLPKSLHRAMVEASDDEGISLNQYIVNVLSYFSGYADGGMLGYDHTLWSSIASPAKRDAAVKPNLRVVYSSDLDQQNDGWKETG